MTPGRSERVRWGGVGGGGRKEQKEKVMPGAMTA